MLVGGGIGHLAAWILDAWAVGEENIPVIQDNRRGRKFGVILDRLIRRYNASSWATVIGIMGELILEHPWNAASASIESASINKAPLPSPTGLIVIDVPETERPSSLRAALDLVERDGVILILEPEVPTGDVGEFPPGKPTTPAQEGRCIQRLDGDIRSSDRDSNLLSWNYLGPPCGDDRTMTMPSTTICTPTLTADDSPPISPGALRIPWPNRSSCPI